MKIYALRHKETQKFMSLEITSNEGNYFCGSYSVALTKSYGDDSIWTTTSREHAEKISNESIGWLISTVESPDNQNVGELEVVEFSMASQT
jgi:hypothetical protein